MQEPKKPEDEERPWTLSTKALPGLPDQTATGHAPRRGVQTNKDTDTDNCDLQKQFCTNKGEIIVSVNII